MDSLLDVYLAHFQLLAIMNKLTSVSYLIPLKTYTAMVKNIYSLYKYVYLLECAGFMCASQWLRG